MLASIREWQMICEMGVDYWVLHDELPTSAYLWRLHALQCARNAAESDAVDKARRDADDAGSRTTTSRS